MSCPYNYVSLSGLILPSFPPAPKPSGIKPPAHWLMPQNENKTLPKESSDESKDTEIYEDLKQFFNSTASPSSVVSNSVRVFRSLFHLYPYLCKLVTEVFPNIFNFLCMRYNREIIRMLDVFPYPDFYSFCVLESSMGYGNGCSSKFISHLRTQYWISSQLECQQHV